MLAALGFLLYAWRTWTLAHTLTTMILDESMYLYKGYLFAAGIYSPYQDYGPLTNHMPLSFLIPGYVQAWFGPSMEVGRLFAFLVSLIMLVGVWVAFYKLAGRWWGAAGVWFFALNPAWQEVFSQGLSQGIVNAFIIWAFVLLLGRERSAWQLVFSSVLAVLAVMTRINTLPIFIMVLVYIFWQHGWRKGLAAAIAGILVGVLILAPFYPGVLKFLSGWIPEGLLDFVEPFRRPYTQQHVPEGFSYFPLESWINQPESLQFKGINAFIEGLMFNFVPWMAVIATLVLWPDKRDWEDDYRYRISVFLLITWVVMAGMHIWVAMSGTSCRFFCLAGYFTFFNLLALLLLPATSYAWNPRPAWLREAFGWLALAGVVAGTMRAHVDQFYFAWYRFMHTPIPRISEGRIVRGETGFLLSLLENKLNLDYEFLILELPPYIYWILLLLLVSLVPIIHSIMGRRSYLRFPQSTYNFILFITLGALLGYTAIFYSETPNLACEEDVIQTHEATAGEILAVIEPDSLVYLDLTSSMLLLYMPDMQIFPPQLNTGFNYVEQSSPSESDEIYRFSFWNEDLEEEWIKEADYLLIPGQFIDEWQPRIDSGELDVVEVTSPYESCRAKETTVHILEAND